MLPRYRTAWLVRHRQSTWWNQLLLRHPEREPDDSCRSFGRDRGPLAKSRDGRARIQRRLERVLSYVEDIRVRFGTRWTFCGFFTKYPRAFCLCQHRRTAACDGLQQRWRGPTSTEFSSTRRDTSSVAQTSTRVAGATAAWWLGTLWRSKRQLCKLHSWRWRRVHNEGQHLNVCGYTPSHLGYGHRSWWSTTRL